MTKLRSKPADLGFIEVQVQFSIVFLRSHSQPWDKLELSCTSSGLSKGKVLGIFESCMNGEVTEFQEQGGVG